MNPELYTEEFRAFKYLSCSPELVGHFKEAHRYVNSIQPVETEYDPNFKWPHRVEFLEQIFDLQDETLYIVQAIYGSGARFDSTMIRDYAINHPCIARGINADPLDHYMISAEQISYIENNPMRYFLIEYSTLHRNGPIHSDKIIDLSGLPVVMSYKNRPGFSALFYNEGTSREYETAVSDHVKKYFDTISTIKTFF
jgi:hypothetical protein